MDIISVNFEVEPGSFEKHVFRQMQEEAAQEISVQVAIEWRDQLDQEIEHVNRLLDPIGPASELMTYRIELGLKEIRESFEEQVARINVALGKAMVRI